MSYAKTAKPIEMPFGGATQEGSKNHVLERGLDLVTEGALLPAHDNLPTLSNVPAQRTRGTNAFAAVRGDMTRCRCGLLSHYFGHLFLFFGCVR